MTGGGGGRLSKLGTALVVIFVITVVALFAQFFYVLWRRRVFRRHANSVGRGVDEVTHSSPSESSTLSPLASSKELLYFFCTRPQLRLDRNSMTADSGASDLESNRQSDVEVIDVELLKIQGMFGPPRFLFTIKEEEREDLELPPKTTLYPAAEKKIDDDENGGSVSLEKYFQAEEDSVVVVDIDDCSLDDATPFSTPCASPVYFTPSASPVHKVVNDRSTNQGLMAPL